MKKIILLFCMLFLLLTTYAMELQDDNEIQNNFYQWLENFKIYAKEQHNINDETLSKAFKDVKYKHKVIKLDRNQPEFKKTFFDYYDDAIHPSRIKRGKAKMEKNKRVLDQVYKKYGVPPQVVVALWGMETDYGRNMGRKPIFQSLATLSFDHRRSKFFTNELIQALKIVQGGHTDVEDMIGSWAGAFGNFQFMPSTYMAYAVDGDGDGKIDLRNSTADALYSTANFLHKLGWNGKYRWGRPVSFNKKNKKIASLVNAKGWKTVNYFSNIGVKTYGGRPLPKSNIDARLVAPAGIDGPIFMVYRNFDRIKMWNNSTNYAISVGMLSDALIFEKPVELKRK